MSESTIKSKIIILIGFQASTKSTTAKDIIQSVPNAIILSRDIEGGTIDKLLEKAEVLLQQGKVVIMDNTNLTREVRAPFITLAKKYKVQVDAQYFKSSLEDCQIRHLQRMYSKFGEIYQTGKAQQKDPHIFGPAVLFKSRKILEEPKKDEGFSRIILRPASQITWPENHINKALFLDIDGTIRKTKHLPNKYPTHPDEVELLHSAGQMRTKLETYRTNGYRLIGLSNQSGIAKGILTEEKANEIFDRTRTMLGYTEEEFPILYCPHRAAPISCFCRKPQSGMPVNCIMKYKLNPAECIMVGDMTTDETMAKRLNIQYIDVKKFW